jgi:hypothetical protein
VNWRPVVVAVLVIALVAAVFYLVNRSSSLPEGYNYEESAGGATAPSGGEAAEPALKTVAVRLGGAKQDAEEEKPFVYSSNKLRNPMAPLLAKPDKTNAQRGTGQRQAAPAAKHKLGGIIWSDVHPYAIIDGNAIGVGEKLRDGSSVAEIGKDFVVLKRGGATSRLVLK